MQVTGNNLPQPHKSIRLFMDGLSFFQDDSWKRIDFTTNDTQLKHALATCLCHPFFAENTESTLQVHVNLPYTTLIPSHLLSKQESLDVVRFLFPETESNKDYVVFNQPLQSFDITLLFALPIAYYNLIKQIADQIHWTHETAEQLEHSLKLSKKNGQQHVWMVANNTHIHLSVAKNGELLFANHFQVCSQEDILYYCAQTYEQHGLSQQDTPLYIEGNPSLQTLLQKYIVNCHIADHHANH